MSTLDVIIPVKDRAIADCIASLLSLTDCLHHLWICDGGSTQLAVTSTLARLELCESVTVVRRNQPTFNKAALLNAGIRQARADWILVSDADILWTGTEIAALAECLQAHPDALCHIAHVSETDPAAIALSRPRYRYRLQKQQAAYHLTLEQTNPQRDQRPGYGLVCAHRNTFFRLGGYKESFVGWGWEDQDLLIRAGLLEIPILSTGAVGHQSHTDGIRNQFHGSAPPMVTRDRNILHCLQAIQRGELWGDLGLPGAQPMPLVQVEIPAALFAIAQAQNEAPDSQR
jgi:glycosyltransferase involved in cell wall biosynthesis